MTNLIPIRLLAVLAASFSLSACALRGEPSMLHMSLPQAWNEQAAQGPGQPPEPAWWTGFASAELDWLIETALTNSPDIAIAALRIRQAEAVVSGTGASLFPSLNFSGSTGSRRIEAPGEATSVSDSTGASLNVSYEIDLWGRIDANVRADRASLEGSHYDLETARLTLVSGVANTYFQVLAMRARLEVAHNNLAIAARLLRIVETRYRNGAASALDFSRQQTAVLTQRATLRPLEILERQTVSALAVLLGMPPQGFRVAAADLQNIVIPDIAPGLPGQLLTRRPDLAKAESQLVAADANLDAARAALLPSVQLSGAGGVASRALLSLASPTSTFALTASLSQTIFDGGRLRSQVHISDAQRSLRLAELRYREGTEDLASVLDAQRTLYTSQDQLAQIRLSRLSSAVDMVKVLGGGWERPDHVVGVSVNPKEAR